MYMVLTVYVSPFLINMCKIYINKFKEPKNVVTDVCTVILYLCVCKLRNLVCTRICIFTKLWKGFCVYINKRNRSTFRTGYTYVITCGKVCLLNMGQWPSRDILYYRTVYVPNMHTLCYVTPCTQ